MVMILFIIRFYECLIYLKGQLLEPLKISIKIYDILG